MRAVIGILCSENVEEGFFFLRQDYLRAIEKAGACPIILPITEDLSQLESYLSLCQGLILSGGGDISPEFLEVSPEEKDWFMHTDKTRDICELSLIQKAVQHKIPLLGICRGCQMLNVALGGTLVAHITQNTKHMQQEERHVPTHKLQLQKHSLLRTFTSEPFPAVNSFHHQAILTPGMHLHVTARALDGTIEAIEHNHLPFCIGVQWHPEALQDLFAQRLFSAFVQIASQVAKNHKLDFFHSFYQG